MLVKIVGYILQDTYLLFTNCWVQHSYSTFTIRRHDKIIINYFPAKINHAFLPLRSSLGTGVYRSILRAVYTLMAASIVSGLPRVLI